MKRFDVLLYTLTKYFELGIVALVSFHFAKFGGPEVFGRMSIYFVIITYSAFLALGINSSFVKHYSVSLDKLSRDRLVVYNFLYNIFMSFISYFIVYIFFNDMHGLPLAVICSLNLVRGSVQAILRAKNKTILLGFFNATYSLFFLFFYIVIVAFPENYETSYFLRSWSLAMTVAILVGITLISGNVFSRHGYSLIFFKSVSGVVLRDSLLLSILNIGNTVFISSDRLILNIFRISHVDLGFYQFADNISAIFHIGSSSILYVMVPHYMEKLSSKNISIDEFSRKFFSLFIKWFFVLVFYILVVFFIVNFMFYEYINSMYFVVALSFQKYLLLFLFIPTVILTTFSKEYIAIKCYFFAVSLLISFQYVIASYFTDAIFYMPLISICAIFFLLFMLSRFYVCGKFDVA